MNIKKTLSSLILVASLTAHAQTKWPTVTEATKPWTRWWWMGSAVDEKGLDAQINALSNVGFGGVEIVPIYGAIGYESKYISYLSPKWMQMLDYTVKQASAHQMGVDISVGTGWPIGGPKVSLEDAASKLVIQNYSLKAGETLSQKIIVNDPKQKIASPLGALVAYGSDGKTIDLTDKVSADGTLNWKPESGDWQLYAAFTGKTRQAVKRAALGGEGYTLDHFSKTAITNYLSKTYDSAFGNSSHGVHSFFNDSYEVFGADWTPDFFNEFKQRRGYDLKPYLKTFVSNDKSETLARLKTDYRETMSDMMLDYFTTSYTKWAHGKHAINTNQAHGSPGNLLDLYAAVDQPECETFGSSYFPIPGLRRDSADIRNVDPDPIMLKFASSAAHFAGKPLTSCETFTWLTEHFKTSWSQCKPEVEQVFLSGINHVYYHGTTYSPADAPWPGWLFYASVNFVPNNSLWPHLKGLNDYITRCQSVLQAGQPDNEIKAYWPIYDAWNNPEGMDMPLKVHDVDKWLHPTPFYKNVIDLQNKGYSIDFVSDKMLEKSTSIKSSKPTVYFIAACNLMPVKTLQSIINLAKNGNTIVMESLPKDVPGMGNLEAKRTELKQLIANISFKKLNDNMSEAIIGSGKIILSEDVQKGLQYANIKRETLSDVGLQFIRRKTDDGKYYYLVNHTPNNIDTTILIEIAASSVVILDPQTGEMGLAKTSIKGNETSVKIQIKSGEAIILKTSNTNQQLMAWKYLHPTNETIALNENWNIHFTSGGPTIPKDKKMDALQSWTMFDDPATQSFAGTAEYSTTFNVNKKATDYLLQLGKVDESAKVWINGKEVGILWSIPFEIKIGQYLKQGENTIKIEVANLMANRIKYMDQNKIEWRKYHEINFVNINYKDFDASNWKVQPSGLEGPVVITALK